MRVTFYPLAPWTPGRYDVLWRWKINAANGRIIGASTEGYTGKRGAVANFETVTGRRLVNPGGECWASLMHGPSVLDGAWPVRFEVAS